MPRSSLNQSVGDHQDLPACCALSTLTRSLYSTLYSETSAVYAIHPTLIVPACLSRIQLYNVYTIQRIHDTAYTVYNFIHPPSGSSARMVQVSEAPHKYTTLHTHQTTPIHSQSLWSAQETLSLKGKTLLDICGVLAWEFTGVSAAWMFLRARYAGYVVQGPLRGMRYTGPATRDR